MSERRKRFNVVPLLIEAQPATDAATQQWICGKSEHSVVVADEGSVTAERINQIVNEKADLVFNHDVCGPDADAILWLHHDMRWYDGALERLLKLCARVPEAVVAAPLRWPQPGRDMQDYWAAADDALPALVDSEQVQAYAVAHLGDVSVGVEVPVLMRRAVFVEHGGLVADLGEFASIDLQRRLWSAGKLSLTFHGSVFWHAGAGHTGPARVAALWSKQKNVYKLRHGVLRDTSINDRLDGAGVKVRGMRVIGG